MRGFDDPARSLALDESFNFTRFGILQQSQKWSEYLSQGFVTRDSKALTELFFIIGYSTAHRS